MRKIEKTYLDIINNNIILQAEEMVSGANDNTNTAENKHSSTTSSNNTSNSSEFLNTLMPILAVAGGTSLLFGKGLFGFGYTSQDKRKSPDDKGFLGGSFGHILGFLTIITFLPGVWSDKNVVQRLSSAFSSDNPKDFFKNLFGCGTKTDAQIKKAQDQAQKQQQIKQNIQNDKKQYQMNLKNNNTIIKYLNNQGYDTYNVTQLTKDITVFKIKLINQQQLNAVQHDENDCAIAILSMKNGINSLRIASIRDITSMITGQFTGSLMIAFTPIPEDVSRGKSEQELMNLNTKYNYYLHGYELYTATIALGNLTIGDFKLIKDNKGNTVLHKDAINVWLSSAKFLANGLLSLQSNGMTYLNELFGNIQNINSSYQIKIPENIKLLAQQKQISISQLENDIKNNKQLSNIEQDSVLNKFNSNIIKIEKSINDNGVKNILNIIKIANQEDYSGFIIASKNGDDYLYFTQDQENGFLTSDINQALYISNQEVEKLDGPSDLKQRLQDVLLQLKVPQILKMKNGNIQIQVIPINIQFTKKLNKMLK